MRAKDDRMIFIGGTCHGQVKTTYGGSRRIVVPLPRPLTVDFVGSEKLPFYDLTDPMPQEIYELRTFGVEVNGEPTQRRVSYMVLKGLSNRQTALGINSVENESER